MRIDIVALGKFLQHRGLSADYVVSGSLAGLPPDLARRLLQLERAEDAHSPPDV